MSDKKKTILDYLNESMVWKSIFRSGVPRTRRQRMYAVLGNVFLHLHPARLPRISGRSWSLCRHQGHASSGRCRAPRTRCGTHARKAGARSQDDHGAAQQGLHPCAERRANDAPKHTRQMTKRINKYERGRPAC